MKSIIKAMKSEYGNQWERMSDNDQLMAIAAFLHYYSKITKTYIIL